MTAPTNLEPWNDPALEVRVVAHVLGEVSAFEAAEVARLLEENPELAAFARRIEAVHGLLAEDARPLGAEDWKLSPERRDKVLAMFGGTATDAAKPLARQTRRANQWLRRSMVLAMAASMAFGLFVLGSLTLSGGAKRKFSITGLGSDQEFVPLQTSLPQDLRVGTPKDLSKALASHESKRQQVLAAGGDPGEWQKRLEEKPSSDLAALSIGGRDSKNQPFTVRATGDKATLEGEGRRSGETSITRWEIDQELAEKVPADALSRREDVAGNSLYRGKGQAAGGGGAEAKPDGFAYTGGVDLERGMDTSVTEIEGFVNYGRPIADGKGDTDGDGTAAAARPARPVAGAKSPVDESARYDAGGKRATVVAGTEVTLDETTRYNAGGEGRTEALAGKPVKPGEPSAATTSPDAVTGEVAETAAGAKGKKLEELAGLKDGRSDSEVAEAAKLTGDRSRITVQREIMDVVDTAAGPPEREAANLARADQAFPVTPATPTAFAMDAMGNLAPTEYAPPELPGSAGLSKRDEVADHKSPVLGDIPVVGKLFQDRQQNQWQDGDGDGSAKDQVERLRQASTKMEKAREELEGIAIPSFNQPGGGRGDEVDDGSASLIMRDKVSVSDLTKEVETIRAQSAALKSLEGEQLVRKAAMLGIEDSTIAKYYPQFNELVLQEKQAEEAGLGADHPQRRGIRSQRETVQNLLTSATRDVRESLDIKLQQREKNLEAARKATDTEETNQKLLAYEQAKAEYNAQKAIVTKHVEIAQANGKELGFDWLVADEAAKVDVTGKMKEQADGRKGAAAQANMPALPPAPPPPPATIESSDTRVDPVSTFSLNVSDVSFRLGARALLADNKLPEPGSVRTEDYVNAQDYGDALPARGEAVTAVVQQSAQPFVPGRNLVRVGLRTAESGRANGQPLSLTILLDQSGSMERPDRAAAVRKTLADLAGLLQADDVVTVIGFARTPRLLVDRLPGKRAAELSGLVLQAPPQGGTNLEAAFDLAAQAAARQFKPAAGNRVVLITDGAANLGQIDPQALSARVEGWRRAHIAFDACGVGTAGVDDTMLEALARKGDGRYLVVAEDTDVSLAKELAGAFRPAARNVKVQVRFNPDRVGKFHLLGFEKHRLAEQDFRDDTVDAAELAAAEQGNALYQVELLPGGSGEIGDVAVRFQDTATGKMVERHWTIPYDVNTPALDRAEPSMQLAATAGLLAESLKGSPLGNLVRLKDLRALTLPVRGAFRGDENVSTLLQMVEKASALKGE